MNNNNNGVNPGNGTGPTPGATLLVQLRNDQSLSYCALMQRANSEQEAAAIEAQTMSLMLLHRSGFPLKIREAIQAATSANQSAYSFCDHVKKEMINLFLCEPQNETGAENTGAENTGAENTGASTALWTGLDSEVDTEEEVELAVRLFPSILKCEKEDIHDDPVLTYQERYNPIFWVSVCIKSLPFVPLLLELAVELGLLDMSKINTTKYYFHVFSLRALVLNSKLMQYRDNKKDEGFDRKLDQISLSVMIALREKGFFSQVQGQNIYRAASSALCLKPYYVQKRLSFLVAWDPYILTGDYPPELLRASGPLLNLMFSVGKHTEGESLLIFQMLTEAGISNFPEDFGFLFHEPKDPLFRFINDGKVFPFHEACDVFGKDTVEDVVNKIVSKIAPGRSKLFHTIFIAAATNPDITLDGLYFLCRQDPTAWNPVFRE